MGLKFCRYYYISELERISEEFLRPQNLYRYPAEILFIFCKFKLSVEFINP
jgi:hypothetical protein